jgi:hypothetical protein
MKTSNFFYEKPSIKFNRARAPTSVKPRITPIMTITSKTKPVNWRASGHVGQDTLRSSPIVSRKNDWIALGFLPLPFSAKMDSFNGSYGYSAAQSAALSILQARQDLNPQPLVLETSALPIELLA